MSKLPQDARILLDARWLHAGGAGRATELLLKGLHDLRPRGTWILWGPPDVEAWVWRGAEHAIATSSPRSLGGQRRRLSLPRADCAIFMHQIRPLIRKPPSVVLFHDTIPLRTAANRMVLRVKHAYLKKSAHLATRLVTVSHYSASCLERDLDVARSKMTVVRYPADPKLTRELKRLRTITPRKDMILYIGRFGTHKNLARLMNAFVTTKFARSGGELVCVGGTRAEIQNLLPLKPQGSRIRLLQSCPEDELHNFYAAARLLVLPSLEEGFGLPVWEAQTIGLPTAVADAGALPELVRDPELRFHPLDEVHMATVLDRALNAPAPAPPFDAASPTTFAEQICCVVAGALPPTGKRSDPLGHAQQHRRYRPGSPWGETPNEHHHHPEPEP